MEVCTRLQLSITNLWNIFGEREKRENVNAIAQSRLGHKFSGIT